MRYQILFMGRDDNETDKVVGIILRQAKKTIFLLPFGQVLFGMKDGIWTVAETGALPSVTVPSLVFSFSHSLSHCSLSSHLPFSHFLPLLGGNGGHVLCALTLGRRRGAGKLRPALLQEEDGPLGPGAGVGVPDQGLAGGGQPRQLGHRLLELGQRALGLHVDPQALRPAHVEDVYRLQGKQELDLVEEAAEGPHALWVALQKALQDLGQVLPQATG